MRGRAAKWGVDRVFTWHEPRIAFERATMCRTTVFGGHGARKSCAARDFFSFGKATLGSSRGTLS